MYVKLPVAQAASEYKHTYLSQYNINENFKLNTPTVRPLVSYSFLLHQEPQLSDQMSNKGMQLS